jgi:hypothetical protein
MWWYELLDKNSLLGWPPSPFSALKWVQVRQSCGSRPFDTDPDPTFLRIRILLLQFQVHLYLPGKSVVLVLRRIFLPCEVIFVRVCGN